MDLYSLNNGELEAIDSQPFALEKDIQSLVECNLESLFGLEFVASEFSVESFRLDTLAYDPSDNAFVIIEYKKGSSYSVVDQGYSYLSVMLNNKAEFILEYNEQQEGTLKRSDVDWSSSRVLFISPSFNSYQRNSVNFKDVPFELYEIKRYEGGLVSFDRIGSTSKQSISSLSPLNADSTISKVSAQVKVHELNEHIEKLKPSQRHLWDALYERIDQYGDLELHITGSYVAVKRGSKTVSFIRFKSNKLNLEFLRGNIKPSGDVSKGYFEADDPKKWLKDRTWTWKSGVQGSVYQLDFTANDQLDYVMFLFEQKYKSLN